MPKETVFLLDIMMYLAPPLLQVNDPRYAKKYGVNRLPALVYFRRKFPSIYRGPYIILANIKGTVARDFFAPVFPPASTASWYLILISDTLCVLSDLALLGSAHSRNL